MKSGRARVGAAACAAALAAAAIGTAVHARATTCADHIAGMSRDERLRCVQVLRESPEQAIHAVAPLAAFLRLVDGATDVTTIVGALDVFRRLGPRAAPAAATLRELLPHRSKLYTGRDKFVVGRLRSYLLLTLGDVGASSLAVPAVLETLANLDARMSAAEVGAAARVAGTLGPQGRPLVPHLMDAIGQPFADEEFSLERFEPTVPASEATTVQREAVRALGRICPSDSAPAIALLRTIADDRAVVPFDSRVVGEARAALDAIDAAVANDAPAAAGAFGAWIPAAGRKRLASLDARVTDSTGRTTTIRELTDRPTLVTFFYARCQNAQKCSAAVGRLGALQRRLDDLGLDDAVRLMAVTYEPQSDTTDRVGRYAQERGLRLGGTTLALRIDPDRHEEVVAELQAPVNFNAGLVNTHGVELTLLDHRGRVARKYSAVLWDNAAVIEDVRRLLAEPH